MDARRPLVGRSAEQAQLLRALDGAATGQPRATLLHGEPGIGKTTLVRDLADRATARGFHVLFGQCLRFGAEVTTHLPFIQAFDTWERGASPETLDRVFPGGVSSRDVLNVRSEGVDGAASGMLFHLADSVDRLADDAPTLLVMDDLQWADPSSLDVLSYLVAGLHAGQKVTLALTYRDTELDDGHRLHGWLADVRRLHAVDLLPISRLSADETEQLVLGIPGVEPRVALAEKVFARSAGNPYLTELLAQEIGDPDEGGSRLGEALLASWHRLGHAARSVTQLVAVAGRPVGFRVLQDLASARGLPRDDVAAAVTEATGEGITVVHNSGEVWFRHPLLAEVIAATLPRWELPELHRAFAGAWEEADGVTDAERATHLALHYAAAEDAKPAFAWALRAADEALRLHAIDEEATHLSAAVDLLPALPAGSRPPTTELLTRAGRCLIAAGRAQQALELYEQALDALDPQQEPLVACRVLTALNFAKAMNVTGGTSASLSDFERALALTQAFPDSRERVDALADLAYFEVFEGIHGAADHAQEAVRLAERLGVDDALAWALVVRAQTRWGTDSGIADAEQAWALAKASGDTPLLIRVTVNLCNSYESVGQLAASASTAQDVYAIMRERGSAQGMSCIGARAAMPMINLGLWDSARSMIRETLALRLSTRWGAAARCGAALLSGLQGDAAAATSHISRARELMPRSELGDELVHAEMMLATEVGAPGRTLDLVESRMSEAVALGHLAADELLQLAARAAADLSEGGESTSGEARVSAMSQLERIESLRGAAPPPFLASGPQDTLHPAWGALYAADRARCLSGDRPPVKLWQSAAEAADRAGLRFEQARSLYFLGRSLLAEPKGRDKAAEALAGAAGIANELQAAPLATLVEQLALQAHIALAVPGHPESAAPAPLNELAGVALTPREAEVLDHVVAGATYAQVARRMFISEKTVSVHVSNLLRKTGTSSRIELAALALRARDRAGGREDAGAADTW